MRFVTYGHGYTDCTDGASMYPHRSKRRHRRRGAALTEAVIVIVFFLMVFGCGSFVHRLYAAKMNTVRNARERAWVQAMQACPSGGVRGESIDSSLHTEARRLFGPLTGMDALDSPVISSRDERSMRIEASGGVGLDSANVESRSLVTCNERVLDLDRDAPALLAWHGLTGW